MIQSLLGSTVSGPVTGGRGGRGGREGRREEGRRERGEEQDVSIRLNVSHHREERGEERRRQRCGGRTASTLVIDGDPSCLE